MGVTIAGVNVGKVTIKKEEGSKKMEMNGSYHLVGSNGVNIAKQSFGGYNPDLDLPYAGSVLAAGQKFKKAIEKEIELILGLNEGENNE